MTNESPVFHEINVQNTFGLAVQYKALKVLRGSYLKQTILAEGVEIGKGHSGAIRLLIPYPGSFL